MYITLCNFNQNNLDKFPARFFTISLFKNFTDPLAPWPHFENICIILK